MILISIILGIVQGLTEFLPISSSGHLVLLEHYFRITEPVTLAVFLHFGTFLSTVVFFFKPITRLIYGVFTRKQESIEYLVYIVIGSIPIVIFALLFKTYIESTFSNSSLTPILLGITGVVLILTRTVKRGSKKLYLFSSLLIGLGQMCAVFPGISRSGMTISVGLFRRIDPKEAFTFSFLLSLPAVLGANVLEVMALDRVDNIPIIIIGMVFSFLFGLLALRILKNIVHKWFHLFGIYCIVISVILLLVQ